MIGKILIACVAFTCVLANPPPPAPVYSPYSSPPPAYKPYPPPPPPPPASIPPYGFKYAVVDAESGVDIAADEKAEYGAVSGSYKVTLPDGRIKTVTYTVEGDSGFVADVQFEAAPAPAPYPKYVPYKA
ncbi:cuticle protein 7 [Lepeophtheirus salmonis]|uniref:cuticle protein 7 n=1 Tax=Lepeophtheirus salmonis TaxID=72036 RepID=UPI001AEB6004|nr:cuticle protein 7-like [Lepeophtheirus salmonis]